MTLRPAQITTVVVTPGGQVRSVSLLSGDTRVRRGPPGGAASGVATIDWSRLDPRAPARLANAGAARLGVAIEELNYLVAVEAGGAVSWTAFFKDGRSVRGNAAGRIAR
jgi:hypothetical protein